MKLKYYMRGVGTGILFTLFIFVVIIIPNLKLESKITEATKDAQDSSSVSSLVGHGDGQDAQSEDTADVITTGNEDIAGNITATEFPVKDETVTDSVTDDSTSAELPETTDGTATTPKATPTVAPTQEPTATPEATPTVAPTQEPDASPTEAPTSTPTPAIKDPTPTPKAVVDEEAGTVKFTITAGMTSETFSKAMEKYGVVDSWEGLNSYIGKKGYAKKIQVGTFTFTKGMTYEDICRKITGKNYN